MLAALKQPDTCIHDLPLLAAQDRNTILMGFNATNAQFPSGYCVHELFENQADENPAAVCLALRKLQLSYGDVEALANRLATHLVDLGAGASVPVGLMMPRCAEMYIAMLAILKVRPVWDAVLAMQSLTAAVEVYLPACTARSLPQLAQNQFQSKCCMMALSHTLEPPFHKLQS